MLSRVSLACVGALTLLPHSALAANGADPWSIETAAPDEAVLALAEFLADRQHRKHMSRCAAGGSSQIQGSRLSGVRTR